MGKVRVNEGSWSGYILTFGDKVPGISEDLLFSPDALYELGRLYTQGEVTRSDGEYPIGQLAHIKRDDVGIHVLVILDSDELPTEIEAAKYSLVWSYTVDRDNLGFMFTDNPQTGEKKKVLASYPILSVSYSLGGLSDGLSTPAAIINRPTRTRRKPAVRTGPSESHS